MGAVRSRRRRHVGSLHTPLCDLLGIEYPILQAGMGRSRGTVTPPALVAAVSEASGLGCVGGAGLSPDELRETIREVRRLTRRPFAVDLLLPAKLEEVEQNRAAVRAQIARDFPDHLRFVHTLREHHGLPHEEMDLDRVLSPELVEKQVEVVLEERAPVFVAGLGDPSQVVQEAHRRDIKVIGIAGNLRNALRQREAGVDGVIAQGYEAGGHTGTIGTFALLPQVVDALDPIPVIAAGGIGDGRGLVAALALGAVGIWCGTAFLFAQEAHLPEVQQKQLINCRSEELVVSRCYTGKTARVFRNPVVQEWGKSDLDPLPMPLQWVLMDDFVASAEAAGRFDLVNNPAGQVAGMLRQRKPARQIVQEMVSQANQLLSRQQARRAAASTDRPARHARG